MEAVAVVGLASNVLQFVEITAKLIRISNELRNDAASSENQDHRVIATHFEALAQGIKTSARAISQTSATASSEDKALQPVADRCCELANDLLGRLQKCGIQPGQNGSRFQRTKVAFKSLWNKKEIVEISNRLQLFRSELNLHYTTQIRKTQLDQQTRHSTTDDAQETLRRIDNLGTLIGDLQLDINGTVNSRCSEILDCITVSQSENSQLHAQATQQALVGHAALLNRLDNLQLSMETANISLGNVQTRQSETLDSIARVRVENSAFLVSATQQVSSDDSSGASFRNVIKPLFEEFMDRALTEMKKEYRNTARSETDNLMNNVLPVLHEMQYRSRATRQDSPDVTDETESQIDRGDIGLRSSSFESQRIKVLHGQASRRQDKKSVTIVYRNSWDWKTKLGNFFLAIHDRVYFDAYGRATSIYELTAQFVPSSSWFSTGCSIKYETISDARGDPKFCFRPPKTFRVLEEDHYVWDAIRRNDVSSIQSMLSQKLISPSDQNSVGFTLLHEAMLYNGLDITKALVQSGADINACDHPGYSVLETAIASTFFVQHWQNYDTFHYLLGLVGIEKEVFWENERLIFLIVDYMERFPEAYLPNINDWVSACRSVDLDFNVSGGMTFLEVVIHSFSYWTQDYIGNRHADQAKNNCTALFDAIIQQGIGCDDSPDTIEIPVACAAYLMRRRLNQAYKESLLAREASSTLSIPYRGYYAHPVVAQKLNFLEHVISKGIAQRPDCIFDSYRGETTSDWFSYYHHWKYIWAEMLEDHGFDVDWVYEEDDRRQRVMTGETSTHEVSVGVDAASMRDVRRRRGYENTDE